VRRLWNGAVSLQREVEATPWGGVVFGNIWPAYVFALPLGARVWAVLGTPRGETLHARAELLQDSVTIAFLALVVVLFAVRRRQLHGRHTSVAPGVVALAGTFLLSAAAYLPIDTQASTAILLAASAVVVFGTLFTIWSLATLGRCFGLFPEVRGLVLRGPYRLVRHPVYLGELVSAAGLLLARPHVLVLVVLAIFVVLQYWRTVFEERAMSAAYPAEYPAYALRVPRLVPGWH
jgi:protein-S-isoprenylcysteine O-methyltransferase Ste14